MLIRKFYSAYPPKGRIFIAALVCAFYGINADAKPDMRPLGPNIADRGSAYYHFNVAYFDSLDGERHYKVWTAIPNAAPPAEGYPILYALDGNAVMDRVSDSLLAQLTQKTPPVIVAVGYQTTLPFDQNARAYDYRPTVKENSADSGRDSRKSGGSEAFRQLLQNTIVENVERGMKIDPLASSRFRIYFSASPSLGRGNASLLDKMAEAKADAFSQKSLYLMEGAVATQRVSSAGAEETRGNVLQTVSLLKKKGVAVNWWPYPGLSHGEMFNASLQSALLKVADGTLRRRPAPAIR